MKKSISFFVFSILFSTSGIALSESSKITLSKPITVGYSCNDNSKIKVTYYNLSDNSLSFVKLTFKGVTHTLPNVISASGIRYSNMHKIEWREKGGTATLDEDITNEKSKIIECKEIVTR